MTAFPRPHVSHSELLAFHGCEWRWKLDYVEGLRSKFYGVHTDFGTSVHQTIELYRTKKDPVSLTEAVFLFREMFSKLHTDNFQKYSEKDKTVDRTSMLEAGERIIRSLDECRQLRDAQVIYNELPLSEDISRTDGVKVRFKGFIDMVVRGKDGRGRDVLFICDFKTCSWGWDLEKKRDPDVLQQLFLYKHFLCKKLGLDPELVRTVFVLLKKRPRKGDTVVEWLPVSAGPKSLQRAIDGMNSDISRMAHVSEHGDHRKNLEACVSKFGDTCPYHRDPRCGVGLVESTPALVPVSSLAERLSRKR